MNYNPFDLVPMRINGNEIYGRPFELDSEIFDNVNMKNSFGEYVKPKKLSTVCPDCGKGMTVDVVLGNPPFTTVETNCDVCHPSHKASVDPFVNPVTSGQVQPHELDPLIHNPHAAEIDNLSVAERLEAKDVDLEIEKVVDSIPEPVKSEVVPEPVVEQPKLESVPELAKPVVPEPIAEPPKLESVPEVTEKVQEQPTTAKQPTAKKTQEKPKKTQEKPVEEFKTEDVKPVGKPQADGLTEETDIDDLISDE